ncbi:hypothetical protein SEPCBS119000_003236 [Sporothrix epigloea]|uniref:Serine/threonine-protein kinase ppk6 n=1 Tax=Sporothrix epigloea TaxID=1892477 RepID=A0ABP0DKI5_9PEZI
MSADLFAQFGPSSGISKPAAKQQQERSRPQASPGTQESSDFFASFDTAHSQPHQQVQAQNGQSRTDQPQQWFSGTPTLGMGAGIDGGWGNTIGGSTGQTATQDAGDDEDDDTWGDFEEAATSNQAELPPASEKTVIQAHHTAPLSQTLVELTEAVPKPRKPADPNVLFDVEDFEANGGSDTDEYDDDDEFGDYETGRVSALAQTLATTDFFSAQPFVSDASKKSVPRPAATAALVDLLSLSDPEPAAETLPLSMQPQSQALPNSDQPKASTLPSLGFGSTKAAATPAPISSSYQARTPSHNLADIAPQSGHISSPSPATALPSSTVHSELAAATKQLPHSDDAGWEAWDSVEPTSIQSAPVAAKKPGGSQAGSGPKTRSLTNNDGLAGPGPASSDWDWDAAEEPSLVANTTATTALPPAIANAPAQKAIPDKTPPPTNVPPPSVLLSLFLTLIALPDEVLFKPIASEPVEVRNRIIGDPKTVSFLRNYFRIIVVAGRVIAGRKQRWHRDKFLMQSMSISSAGSSKGGGMKLTGLDKAKGQREDREAADVVAAWLRQVGKLRSAAATANAALVAAEAVEQRHVEQLKVPELQSTTLPVTVAKHVPTATKPCVICGLRRDERVRGIDGDDVDDIFSEWWIEHWGHRSCRNFWAEHEAALRSR